jgi:hypothetical protein
MIVTRAVLIHGAILAGAAAAAAKGGFFRPGEPLLAQRALRSVVVGNDP